MGELPSLQHSCRVSIETLSSPDDLLPSRHDLKTKSVRRRGECSSRAENRLLASSQKMPQNDCLILMISDTYETLSHGTRHRTDHNRRTTRIRTGEHGCKRILSVTTAAGAHVLVKHCEHRYASRWGMSRLQRTDRSGVLAVPPPAGRRHRPAESARRSVALSAAAANAAA